MIHLDTNYLIGLLVRGSPQAIEVGSWLAAGRTIAASALAWSEFLSGPITAVEITHAESLLQSRITFGHQEAALSAELFNKTGRRRGTRFDCLIAATAINAQAELATVNQRDFASFLAHGLRLAGPAPAPPSGTTTP